MADFKPGIILPLNSSAITTRQIPAPKIDIMEVLAQSKPLGMVEVSFKLLVKESEFHDADFSIDDTKMKECVYLPLADIKSGRLNLDDLTNELSQKDDKTIIVLTIIIPQGKVGGAGS